MNRPIRPLARFSFHGHDVPVHPGDTVAAALVRAGHIGQRITRQNESRGLFCGMGVCHDCLVRIDGRAAQRACITPASDVQEVARHADDPTAAPGILRPLSPPPAQDSMPSENVDLAIIGAGPAGMTAALGAHGHGLSLRLVDERKTPGGQYFKPGPPPHPDEPIIMRRDRQAQQGDALRDRLTAAGVPVQANSTIWHARRTDTGFELGIFDGTQARLFQARAIVIATGAYERPPPIPGWTLPGVVTVGAAQGLVRSHQVAPGQRIIVASHGPLGLQLAAELCRIGHPPIAVLERARPSRPGALRPLAAAFRADAGLVLHGIAMRARLLAARVPVLEGWEAAELTGSAQVTGVTARRLRDGAERHFAADTICVGEGLLPQTEIARALGVPCAQDDATGFLIPQRDAMDGATMLPGVWVVGDGGGMGGAQVAQAQGYLAGIAAITHLGASPEGIDAGAQADSRAQLARARRFQSALWQIYAAQSRQGAPRDDTLLCRCESVTWGAARAACGAGTRDLGALKRLTRLGMGRCQGRYCAGPAALLTGTAGGFAPQTPLRPVPAAVIALEKPEWGGHRRAPTPPLRAPDARRARDRADLPAQVDLAIIGAGIMGCAAALQAARRGMDVVVLDRGGVNGESSGGNAGSLHLQLLSFDFGTKTGGRGDALLQTLPLQRDSIALWQQLERDLGTDFEIQLDGGLMLAEDARQIDFLCQKVAAERRIGIEVEVIDRAGIAAIAPAVSDRMIAAAWCSGEGKINPLLATPAVASAARVQGVRFHEGVQITGLSVQPEGGFVVQVADRQIRARRLILSAGGWTGALSAMLDVPLPIHGAPLQMVVSETAPKLAPCLLAHCDRHLTMKQAAAGNLIIGGAWSAAADPVSGRSHILRDSLEGNLWVAQRVIPDLAGLQVLRAWAAMNVDIDGAPLVGQLPGVPGCVVVAGANGYTLGPLLGRAAADCVLDGRLDPALSRFSPDRLTAPG